MKGLLYLAWRDLVFHKTRSLILFACLFIMVFLPIVVARFVQFLESQFSARADETPLILGSKGSRLDLALHALYFQSPVPEWMTLQDEEDLQSHQLSHLTVPIHFRFSARNFPIVGTRPDYFDFRGLSIHQGSSWKRIGDCVLGYNVAKKLNLAPGDDILSDPEEIFDIAGTTPLKMRITGVLSPTNSPDDEVVWVSLKTAWIIQGLGHGHQKIENEEGLSADEKRKLFTFNQITDENQYDFHFHGSKSSRPISALIVVPKSTDAEILLTGRYTRHERQLIRSPEVMDQLLAIVHQARQWLNGLIFVVSVAVGGLMILVIMLSLRLRKAERITLYKLGHPKSTNVLLHSIGFGGLLLTASITALASSYLAMHFAPAVLLRLL